MKNNQANESGKNSEAIINCVLSILRAKKYPIVKEYTFRADELRDIPLDSEKIRADFLIRCIPRYEGGLIIEVKRQESNGTATQKLPYLIRCIKTCHPHPTILILIGQCWTDKWVNYAKGEKNIWLIDVFTSFEELLLWAEGLPEPDLDNPKIYDGLSTPSQPSLF